MIYLKMWLYAVWYIFHNRNFIDIILLTAPLTILNTIMFRNYLIVFIIHAVI